LRWRSHWPEEVSVLDGWRVVVVLPAYNAASTLERTVAELDRNVVDWVLLVDDASTDETTEVASRLGLDITRHERNSGYGANQKTCYAAALSAGADIVVMVHPDYQYSPRLVPAMAAMITSGHYDLVLGSRVLAQSPVRNGMPRYKYLSNRFLTVAENLLLGQRLSEYHTGLRAFSADLLRSLPIDACSDDFVFDNQVIVQAVAAGARIGEVSCPTRYGHGASSISFRRSVRYGFGVLATAGSYRLARWQLTRPAILAPTDPPRFRPPSTRARREPGADSDRPGCNRGVQEPV
jgi:glycosyltransferase involved in cell wall biosynthesis